MTHYYNLDISYLCITERSHYKCIISPLYTVPVPLTLSYVSTVRWKDIFVWCCYIEILISIVLTSDEGKKNLDPIKTLRKTGFLTSVSSSHGK